MSEYRFYTRINTYREYSIFTPDGMWIMDCAEEINADEIVKSLNDFLKRNGLYK